MVNLRKSIAIALIMTLLPQGAGFKPSRVTAATRRLIAPTDLKFLGYYRLPATSEGGALYTVDGAQMALRFVNGKPHFMTEGFVTLAERTLREYATPDAEPSLDVDTAPKLTLVRNWGDIRKGHILTDTPSNGYRGNQMLWDPTLNGVWWTYYSSAYQPAAKNFRQEPNFGFTAFNDSAGTFETFGPWRTENGVKRTSGRMWWVPKNFADTYLGGHTLAVLGVTVSGVNGCSFGPSFSTMKIPGIPASLPPSTSVDESQWDEWQIGNQEVMYHEWNVSRGIDHRAYRAANYKRCNFNYSDHDHDPTHATLQMGLPIWGSNDAASNSDRVTGSLWVDLPDKYGLLYSIRVAETPPGYRAPNDPDGLGHSGYAALFQANDAEGHPADSHCPHNQPDNGFNATGPWSHVRTNKFWIYEPADVAKAATGAVQPWELSPKHVAFWSDHAGGLGAGVPQVPGNISPLGIDLSTRRLYAVGPSIDRTSMPGYGRPVVMVWEILQDDASPQAPYIGEHPRNTTVEDGLPAYFFVNAANVASYEWQRALPGSSNFETIPNAIWANLTLTSVQLTDTGTKYKCVLRNAVGTVTSQAATLTVVPNTRGKGLTAPRLDLPAFLPVTAQIAANYTGGVPVAYFDWNLIPMEAGTLSTQQAGASRPSQVAVGAGSAQASSFQTPSAQANLGAVKLGLGPYVIRVTAVDSAGNRSATTEAFVTLVSPDLAGVRVFPNPWRKDRHPNPLVTFNQLTVETTIKIFTVAGHFVKELPPSSTATTWDLTNDNGNRTASGIYVYLMTTAAGGKRTGKVVVIR